MLDPVDRAQGALLGLAAGDALGTTLEFTRPGSFAPISDMVGGGPFNLKSGQWTDDTSMALCLADSLLACDGFDAADQMRRYTRWYREGYNSSTGHCFDIGNATRAALHRFERTGDLWSDDRDAAGNGTIMRLAPVVLFYAHEPEEAISRAAESSRTTHGSVEAADACRYLAGLMLGALAGRGKLELLAPRFHPTDEQWPAGELAPAIEEVAAGSFLRREPPTIQGAGYVVRSLEAALWAFAKSGSFEEGVLLAVNLGDDADTTGAVYGQLAGAFYGAGGIPERWLALVHDRDRIADLARRLLPRRGGDLS